LLNKQLNKGDVKLDFTKEELPRGDLWKRPLKPLRKFIVVVSEKEKR